jgi:hypothetical protein
MPSNFVHAFSSHFFKWTFSNFQNHVQRKPKMPKKGILHKWSYYRPLLCLHAIWAVIKHCDLILWCDFMVFNVPFYQCNVVSLHKM